MKLSIEETKRKTLELLKSNDSKLVDHITEEYLNSEFEEEDIENLSVETDEKGITRTVIYGHDMSYCWRDNQQCYCYKRGADPASNINNACGSNGKFLRWADGWHHETTGRNCSSGGDRAILRFVKD